MEGLAEDVLWLVLVCDLAGDVADGAAEEGPQGAMRLVRALELLCMGIALVPDLVAARSYQLLAIQSCRLNTHGCLRPCDQAIALPILLLCEAPAE